MAETGDEFAVLSGHEGGVLYAGFSPDGRLLVTASNDRTARLWSAETADELAILRGHTAGVNHAAFSPDGRRVVTASDDSTARLWWVLVSDLLAQAKSQLPVTLTGEERARLVRR